VASIPFSLTEATTSTIGYGALTLTRNGANVPLNSTVVVTPVSSTAYSISGLSGFTTLPGNYVLRVNDTGFQDAAGNAGSGSMATAFGIPPLVTVSNVRLAQNKKHQVTQITIHFSGPVNATEADLVGTYRLATAGKKGSFDAKNAKTISLRSAVYTTANDSVTLTPRKPFALTKTVQLRVYGNPPNGLHDFYNRLLDGDHNGTPGGNAIALLGRAGVTLSAVAQATSRAAQDHEANLIVESPGHHPLGPVPRFRYQTGRS
jgi:hypothetical protein